MNESDARGEDDLGRGEAKVRWFLGCVWRCWWLEMSGFRGILNSKWQEQQNGRTRAEVSVGWSRDKKVLVKGVKETNWLMIMNVRREMLRRVCIECLLCYGSKLETNSACHGLAEIQSDVLTRCSTNIDNAFIYNINSTIPIRNCPILCDSHY